jgi:Response regulator containing CheY-like receiver domain and AraC-type DNA-binding domain
MEELLNMFPQFTHIVERICTPSWQIKQEICRTYNLILIYSGEAEFFCNRQSYRGRRGDLICFKPGGIRAAHTFEDNLMSCFAVDFLYICPVWEEQGWQLCHHELPLEFHQKIGDRYLFARLLDLFAGLTGEWLSGKQNRAGRCRAIFTEIMNLLLLQQGQGELHYDRIRKVEKVIQYMAEHYQEALSLNDLSRVIRISPSYLGNIFKETTGKAPIEYLIGIRIQKAKELIREGCSMTETAYRVGFHDLFYFSKSFKKYEGMTPSEYRKNGIF